MLAIGRDHRCVDRVQVMSSELRLVVEGATKRFGDHPAVDNVSFTLGERESLGLIGESGSGKTTLARMVLGIEVPTSGRISICGYERPTRMRSADWRRQARLVQVVFQDPYASLDPLQSGRGAVEEILRLHEPSISSRDRAIRAAELSETVGLTERQFEARPRDLSGGQRQRVAVAKALAPAPAVVILDEAVSALDVSIQAQVLNLLNDIRERASTSFLFITHDLAVARQVTDRCLVMRRGRVVEEGSTPDLLDRPQHAYTRRLVASVPREGWRPVPPDPGERSVGSTIHKGENDE